MYRSEGKQKETAPDADQQSKDSQSLTKIQEDKAEQEKYANITQEIVEFAEEVGAFISESVGGQDAPIAEDEPAVDEPDGDSDPQPAPRSLLDEEEET